MLVSCGVSKVCLVSCCCYLDTSTAVETENMHEAVAKMKLYRAVHGPIALHGTHTHRETQGQGQGERSGGGGAAGRGRGAEETGSEAGRRQRKHPIEDDTFN